MKEFFIKHTEQFIITAIVIVIYYIIRFLTKKIIDKFATSYHRTDKRSKMIFKYINGMVMFFASTAVLLVWGIEPLKAFTFLSSIIAFVGVALFAQWSVLSNFTAGIIMFFSFPYKIGDRILIHDKDFPFEAIIDDIKTFHTILITDNGERICYPNNLFLQKSVEVKEE
ncbi:mechanosensitive ion channel domain-containing protein [Capnocytophaga sp. ARDL2]|uniref:mechanosensitive ion channel domain-containing protein n=1 Tax=Capnocytophaga sp. ARDL2 TaxID=3238809 RepID=UPI003555E812